MYNTVKILHSYWAYLVLLILVLATLNALIKTIGNKEYEAKDFRISLFTLIVTHIHLLLGIILFFAADYFSLISEMGMGDVMKNSTLRSNIVEHPLTMIVAVALITIGYSKHKKKLTSKNKLKTIAIFYTIALILVLAKIPWNVWFN
ncbi:cytochrome B [Corallibacter vietnamensis]|uniref:Cytochrome B n=1 Tax=Corallibacter vietnamensis TaxID=904130 RepID=A0ABP7GV02_9FLAO